MLRPCIWAEQTQLFFRRNPFKAHEVLVDGPKAEALFVKCACKLVTVIASPSARVSDVIVVHVPHPFIPLDYHAMHYLEKIL